MEPLLEPCHQLLSLSSLNVKNTRESWQTLAKIMLTCPKNISNKSRNIFETSPACFSGVIPWSGDNIVNRILEQPNDPVYENVVNVVHTRDTPISFDELHEKLINRELSIKHKVSNTISLFQHNKHLQE